jgi:hypothetical protein
MNKRPWIQTSWLLASSSSDPDYENLSMIKTYLNLIFAKASRQIYFLCGIRRSGLEPLKGDYKLVTAS